MTETHQNILKKGMAEFVNKFSLCRVVKVEHQKSTRELQPLPIPKWKWEDISIDFIVGQTRISNGNNSIWVIINHLIKSDHFLTIKSIDFMDKLTRLFIAKVVCLRGVPKKIVLDRNAHFTPQFWQGL